MDKIYKVSMSIYVIQKDYMDEPINWDWSKLTARLSDISDFQTEPEIKITELTEEKGIDDSIK